MTSLVELLPAQTMATWITYFRKEQLRVINLVCHNRCNRFQQIKRHRKYSLHIWEHPCRHWDIWVEFGCTPNYQTHSELQDSSEGSWSGHKTYCMNRNRSIYSKFPVLSVSITTHTSPFNYIASASNRGDSATGCFH